MERRPLGSSGISVSPLAVGTSAMGGEARGNVDDRESIAAIHQAIDCGLNLIDTAPAFGSGHAEEVVGKAIQGKREKVVIATKCGLLAPAAGGSGWRRCLSKRNIISECEQSLRRLRVESIDVYSCHRPDPETPLQETMEALTFLREQGKIQAIGVANFGCERTNHAREFGAIHVVQAPFSMIQRRPLVGLIPFGQEHDIAFWGCAPLATGLLTGSYDLASPLGPERQNDPHFLGSQFARNLRLVDELREWADGYNKTLSQFAINWTLMTPGVTTVIVGINRLSQVIENVGALGWAVSDDDRQRIDKLLAGNAA